MERSNFASNARIVAIAAAVVVVLILILQNTNDVRTRILFATVVMPQAVLLVVVLAIGFVIGLLTALRGGKKITEKTESQ
jgi:uncharacterized integral membrane protein